VAYDTSRKRASASLLFDSLLDLLQTRLNFGVTARREDEGSLGAVASACCAETKLATHQKTAQKDRPHVMPYSIPSPHARIKLTDLPCEVLTEVARVSVSQKSLSANGSENMPQELHCAMCTECLRASCKLLRQKLARPLSL
jgi:hypothetical protein